MLAAWMATNQNGAGAPAHSSQTFAASNDAPHIGGDRYTVLRPHARGGLRQVSVAMDRELKREVAIKELLDHAAESTEARARFLREAEVTSQLEHPGIVPVYDLGVGAKGRLYYAMRFIKGTTLQQAIDQLFAQSTDDERRRRFRELLRRFISVCETMAFAHATGVIHRDLKPLNIMLGDYGETLIVDWGLARAASSGQWSVGSEEKKRDNTNSARAADGTLSNAQLTQAGQMLGTPAYMSPEQAAGQWDQLGPASDIFALGAMLYAILTGKPPFVGDRVQVVEQAQTGSSRPARQVNTRAPLALDAVCRTAMAFDPAVRYSSAKELAAEIDRWLGDEPVTAWREPLLVRMGRWARRRRGWVAAATALLVTSVIGLIVGLVAVDKERRQTVAQRERTREALDDMLTADTLNTISMQKELAPQQKKFLERALKYYQEFAQEGSRTGTARAKLAFAQVVVANIYARFNELAKAEAAYRDAKPIWQQPVAEFPDEAEHRKNLAASQNSLGMLLAKQGRNDEAVAIYRETLPMAERLVEEDPKNTKMRNELAGTHLVLGNALKNLDKLAEAETHYRKTVAIREQLIVDEPDNLDFRRDLSRVYNNLAFTYDSLGRQADAESVLRKAIAIREEIVARKPDLTDYHIDLAKGLSNLGMILSKMERPADTESAYRRAIIIQEPIAARFPGVPELQFQLGDWHNSLGVALTKLDRAGEADAVHRRALTIFEKLVASFPKDMAFLIELGRTHILLRTANKAVAVAESLVNSPNPARGTIYSAACLYSQASTADDSADRREEFAARAVELLRRAIDLGMNDAERIDKDTDLESLREREDYRKLLVQLRPEKPKP